MNEHIIAGLIGLMIGILIVAPFFFLIQIIGEIFSGFVYMVVDIVDYVNDLRRWKK